MATELTEDERIFKAELSEYAACQQEVDSNSQCYWTIAAIFIGVSSALLAGFIYGILSNNDLLTLFVNATTVHADKQIWLLRIISVVLGTANIVILCALRRWLKRTNYINDRYFDRMRDIEKNKNMFKSWIIYGIDKYNDLSCYEHQLIRKYRDDKWWLSMRAKKEYAPPSRNTSFVCVFITLVTLWSLILVGTFILPCLISWLG